MKVKLFLLVVVLGGLLVSCDMMGANTAPVPDGGIVLRQILLTKDVTINGIVYRADTQLIQYGNGIVRGGSLKSATTIGGVSYGYQDVAQDEFRGYVGFYSSGEFSGGTLSQDTTIAGITYQGGERVMYYKSGQVLWGRLASAQTINGQEYPSGTYINYDEDGNVTS